MRNFPYLEKDIKKIKLKILKLNWYTSEKVSKKSIFLNMKLIDDILY